jgi:predicted TIM-barrel fold metal-dependent hydrolase
MLASCAGAPDLIMVAHPPELQAGATEEEWRTAWDALAGDGFRGFKIHPNMDGKSADHPCYAALFAAAEAHGKFVILHTGHFTVPGYKTFAPSDARAFAPLFTRHPKVRVCLAHLNRDKPDEVFDLLAAHPQLWADTSWQPADTIRRVAAAVGSDRLLLGSDWPLLNPQLQETSAAALRAAVQGRELEQIGVQNALRFLGE